MFNKTNEEDVKVSASRETLRTSNTNTDNNNSSALGSTQPRGNSANSKNSVISEGITIKGELTGSNNIDIFGNVDGNINLGNNDINVENTAQIKADIVAKFVRVNGKVVGNINSSDKVLVTNNGRVIGNITAQKIEIQDGSYFDGNISMGKNNSVVNISNAPKDNTSTPKSTGNTGYTTKPKSAI